MKVCIPSNAVKVFKQQLGLKSSKVKADRTLGNLRSMVITKHFGNESDCVNVTGNFRYHLYCIAPTIIGMHFEYMELSNGGFYFSVIDAQVELGLPKLALVTWERGIRNKCLLSYDAASVVAMLLTYADLIGMQAGDRFRDHFLKLIEYAKCHRESEKIQRLTNMF